MLSQSEYDELELRQLERRLVEVEDPGRQTDRTESGDAFRTSLRNDIDRLRERISSEKE